MRNTAGQSYRALDTTKDDWTETQWVEAFANDAMLLKRPLFIKDGTAVLVGFKDKPEVICKKSDLEIYFIEFSAESAASAHRDANTANSQCGRQSSHWH